MLKDKLQIALQALTELEQDVADHYKRSAGIVEDRRLTDLFREFSAVHENCGEELGRRLEQMGYLRKESDAERQIFSRLFSHLQAAMSANERLNLLDQALSMEDKIADAVHSALQENIPQDTRQFLERLAGELAERRRMLVQEK